LFLSCHRQRFAAHLGSTIAARTAHDDLRANLKSDALRRPLPNYFTRRKQKDSAPLLGGAHQQMTSENI
jgi:hypothetical protein